MPNLPPATCLAFASAAAVAGAIGSSGAAAAATTWNGTQGEAEAASDRRGDGRRLFEASLRRGLEIVLCLALGLLAVPVLVIAACAIKLDTPGPVLYRQARVGRGGGVFQLYKLRSMRSDAEADGRARWAEVADPRVTRVGRILRLTRIDELPQLLNVLRGEMALVGPRPERPEFVARLTCFIPGFRDRLAVRPGVTGWAQVNHPYGASVEDARVKLAFDLEYIGHRSLAFDLRILLATVGVVLTGRGAR